MLHLLRILGSAVFFALLSHPSFAQLVEGSTLRVDVEKAPGDAKDAWPRFFASSPSHVVFSSNTFCMDLFWVTDGTPGGAVLIDRTVAGQSFMALDPGGQLAGPLGASLPDGTFVVPGRIDDLGVEPVRIDPFAGTAELIGEFVPGPLGLIPRSVVRFGDRVWFTGKDVSGTDRVYSTDGTFQGTQVEPVLPSGELATALAIGPGGLFVFAVGATSSVYRIPSPGAPAILLANDPTGTPIGPPADVVLPFGNGLVFPFDDGISGLEPWASDGTPAGTRRLIDLVPGSGSSFPDFLGVNGAVALFAATDASGERELYLTDGTVGGTVALGDPEPGLSGAAGTTEAAAVPGGFVFEYDFSASGSELWGAGLTPGSAIPLTDLLPGPADGLVGASFASLGGLAYFDGITSGTGRELFVTDGTTAGTSLAVDLAPGLPGSDLAPLAATPLGLLASGDRGDGIEPQLTDGTPAGTIQVGDTHPDTISRSSSPRDPVAFRDSILFGAETVAAGRELYVLSRGEAEADLIGDLSPPTFAPDPVAAPLVALPDRVLFLTYSPPFDRRLRSTTGQAGAVVDLLTLNSFEDGVSMDGVAYLALAESGSPRWLWRSDGTQAGTLEIETSLFLPMGAELATFAGQVWFAADDFVNGLELWRTDGTIGGATLVADLNPGALDSYDFEFYGVAGERLLFTTGNDSEGRELFAVDGGGVVQQVTAGMFPGTESLFVDDWALLGGRALLAVRTSPFGGPDRLLATDGTPAGTAMLDLPGVAAPIDQLAGLVEAGGIAFFATSDGLFQPWTLWRSDGTSGGTQALEVLDVLGVLDSSALGSGPRAVFEAVTYTEPSGWWVVEDNPGSAFLGVSSQQSICVGADEFVARLGDELLVGIDDSLFGAELHAFPIVELGGYVAEPYGTGCGDARIDSAGEARIGETLAVTLVAAPPARAAWLYASFEQRFDPFGPDCRGHLGPAAFVGGTVTNPGGEAAVAFALPAVPSLAGVAFYAQWVVDAPGGPLLGLLELSDGLEVVLGG